MLACVLCGVQCSSEASVSSDVNVSESADSVLSQLSQLIADKTVHSDVIHAFITVSTDSHSLVVILLLVCANCHMIVIVSQYHAGKSARRLVCLMT